MSKPPAHACKISMLWNWYTIDTCFIARSWHVRSRGGFAGSCIGVFFLVMASQWLHRFCRELDAALVEKKLSQKSVKLQRNADFSSTTDDNSSGKIPFHQHPKNPYVHAISHSWLFRSKEGSVVPNFAEHVLRSALYTIEWGLSYIIMLLFMYYNGYIIISCILGAFFGKLLFSATESLQCDDNEDRKCCK